MNEKISSTIKSSDTEETIDIIWTRPIGYAWARFFEKLGVHPNTVTIISMVLGAMAGVCFAFPSYRLGGTDGLLINICGVLLLAWANFYDSADGQLARMTGKKTKLGRILDGAAGEVWFITIYFALVFRLWNQPIPFTDTNWAWIGFCVIAFDGFLCHAGQSSLADYYRNMHLFFLKGKEGSEVDSYASQKEAYKQLSWNNNFFEKLFQLFYANWCRRQQNSTPNLQTLMQKLKEKYGNDIPQGIRDEFRKNSFPLLKWTNFLTFNWRANIIYITCLADIPILYIALEIIVFSAVKAYMNHRHEAFCKEMAEKII